METFVILCLEDEPEVRAAVVRDLTPFAELFHVEEAEDVEDARRVVAAIKEQNQRLALILCDHLLPGTPGVEFLVELNADETTRPARKVLVTGQAGLDDTIKAVNDAGLDHYIAKPWRQAEFRDVVCEQLTTFVINESDNLLPYMALLDAQRLMAAQRGRASDT